MELNDKIYYRSSQTSNIYLFREMQGFTSLIVHIYEELNYAN